MALRWGILGASKIAKDFMIAMKTLPAGENTVVAVGSSTESRAKSFAVENGVAKWYGSYEQLTNDPEVQVVYVAGNTNSHAESCKLALNCGKHVLCEKSFALNLREAKEVLQLAKEKNLFIMEAMWTRFFPLYHHVQDMLGSNTLGDVKIAMANFGFPIENVPRLSDPKMGGSVLLDLGVYNLTFADIVFGGERPEKIKATGHLFDSGVDHTTGVTMLYSNKRIAHVLFSAGAQLPNTASIVGTKGIINFEPPFHCSTKIIVPDGSKEFPLPEPEESTNFINSTGMRYEIDAVRKSILNGETENKLMPHSTTIRIMEYMDEIRHQLGVRFDQDSN